MMMGVFLPDLPFLLVYTEITAFPVKEMIFISVYIMHCKAQESPMEKLNTLLC